MDDKELLAALQAILNQRRKIAEVQRTGGRGAITGSPVTLAGRGAPKILPDFNDPRIRNQRFGMGGNELVVQALQSAAGNNRFTTTEDAIQDLALAVAERLRASRR